MGAKFFEIDKDKFFKHVTNEATLNELMRISLDQLSTYGRILAKYSERSLEEMDEKLKGVILRNEREKETNGLE